MKELYSAGKCEFHVIGCRIDYMDYLILDIGLSHFNNATTVVGSLELSPLLHYYNKHLRFLTSVKIAEVVIDDDYEIKKFLDELNPSSSFRTLSSSKSNPDIVVDILLYRSTYITIGDELIYTANVKVQSKTSKKIIFDVYFSQL